MKAIEARLPDGHAPEQGPMIIAGLLQAVARFVATSDAGRRSTGS